MTHQYLFVGYTQKSIERMPEVGRQIRQLNAAMDDYHKAFGLYPTGGNVHVAKVLTDDNSKRQGFIGWSEKHRGSLGKVLDPWGTPSEILSTKAKVLGIRSAGPERLFGTSD